MPVCSVHLIIAGVVFLHRELVKVIGEVVGGSGVHVPAGVNGVRACLARGSCCSNLALHVPAVVVDAEVVLLEALEAAGCFVAGLVADLADRTVATATTAVAHTTVTIAAILVAAVTAVTTTTVALTRASIAARVGPLPGRFGEVERSRQGARVRTHAVLRAIGRLGATATTTMCGIGGEVVVTSMQRGLATRDALLSAQQLGVQVAKWDRGGPCGDHLDQGVEVLVETIEDAADEFLLAKGLSNRR
jgi:hypothetical protein